MNRVNLFVIGVNKAGTSWLYYLLNTHPDIFMCAEKELFYFGRRYPEELDAYHAHFPFDESYRYFGEATADYCKRERVAQEIHEYAPAAKVLAIVRDPIDRLHSHFYYHKQLGLIGETVSVADLAGPDTAALRANSHYEKMLPVFVETFGPEQFKVVSLEQANANVPAFWEELQTFLGLPHVPVPTAGSRSSNATGSKWFRTLYRGLIRPVKRHAPALYRTMLRSELVSAAKSGLLRLLGTAEKEAIPEAVKAELTGEFQPTYQYLTGLGFSCYEDASHNAPRPAQKH